jgi:hypothetical protein
MRAAAVVLAFAVSLAPAARAADAEVPGPQYRESVALGAMSLDGATELSIRLARHPAGNSGSVWMHLAIDGEAWSLVEEDLHLRAEPGPVAADGPTPIAATPVAEDAVEFRAGGRGDVRFESRMRHSPAMRGEMLATLYAHPSRDPEPGPGDVPIRFELTFNADGPGGRLNEGSRWELFGRVHGRVIVGGRVHQIDLPGKWHEQVGERPVFAPAFTYLNVQGERFGLLAIDLDGRAVGFAAEAGRTVPVVRFEIEPPGQPLRRFEAELDGGEVIAGSARVVQSWWVPVEGQRRPGSGVVVDSNRGPLAGSLNDWQPAPSAKGERP